MRIPFMSTTTSECINLESNPIVGLAEVYHHWLWEDAKKTLDILDNFIHTHY